MLAKLSTSADGNVSLKPTSRLCASYVCRDRDRDICYTKQYVCGRQYKLVPNIGQFFMVIVANGNKSTNVQPEDLINV